MQDTASKINTARAIIAYTIREGHEGEGLIFVHGLTPAQWSPAITPGQMLDYVCIECHGGWDECGCDRSDNLVPWADQDVCPHGLSAWLCADPINHYPSDRIGF